MNRRPAFTLVELVAVIVLTAILTAASIEGLRGLAQWRIASGIGRVEADVRYARDAALLSGRRTACVFDLSDQTYEVRQEDEPSTGAMTATVIDHPTTYQPWTVYVGDLASGLQISSVNNVSTPAIAFDGEGVPIQMTGTILTANATIDFSDGAVLRVYAGSGLSEVVWP